MRLSPALLVLLALVCIARAASPLDEASFYAYPDEKPSIVPLPFNNTLYYLVISNNSPVALFFPNGTSFVRVTDYDVLSAVFASNASVIQAATNYSAQAAADYAIRQTDRAQYAFKRQARFLRETKLKSLADSWANVSRDYSVPRNLKLPVMDTYLQTMKETLDAIAASKTLEASQRYAAQFDIYYGQAIALYRAYLAVLPDYRKSAVSLINATQSIDAALKRGVISATEAEAARRDKLSIEADLVGAENQMINGKPFFTDTPELLASISANATRITALNKRKRTDNTGLYVAAILAFVCIAAIAYFFRTRIAEFLSGQKEEVTGEFSEKIGKLMNKLSKVEQEGEK
jgi:hypothetical protein